MNMIFHDDYILNGAIWSDGADKDSILRGIIWLSSIQDSTIMMGVDMAQICWQSSECPLTTLEVALNVKWHMVSMCHAYTLVVSGLFWIGHQGIVGK